MQWVEEMEKMCQPDEVYWCDGSEEENERLLQMMVDSKMAIRLDQEKRPGCYLFRSDASDVARVENRTFVATKAKEAAGVNNNWVDPQELKATMKELYKGAMKGRTMYIIPFSMGPIGSPLSKIGVEITDSPYVVVNIENHDENRIRGPGATGKRWGICTLPPLCRNAFRRRTSRRALALCTH